MPIDTFFYTFRYISVEHGGTDLKSVPLGVAQWAFGRGIVPQFRERNIPADSFFYNFVYRRESDED
jgi:hypothetical protein